MDKKYEYVLVFVAQCVQNFTVKLERKYLLGRAASMKMGG
jgi:hypothetical protein